MDVLSEALAQGGAGQFVTHAILTITTQNLWTGAASISSTIVGPYAARVF